MGRFVLVGQLLWMGFTVLKVDFRKDFPIGLQPNALSAAGAGREYTDVPTATSNATSRFLLAVGFFAGSIFLVGTALWYGAKHRMNRDEAKAINLDTAWTGNRRFLNRPEAWRGWMKHKLAGTLPKSGFGLFFFVFFAPIGFLLLLALSYGVLAFVLGAIFR